MPNRKATSRRSTRSRSAWPRSSWARGACAKRTRSISLRGSSSRRRWAPESQQAIRWSPCMHAHRSWSTVSRLDFAARGSSATAFSNDRLMCSPGSTKTGLQRAISIRPMATAEKKYHIGLGPGDVGDYVLVPGDPFRTPLIAAHLDASTEVAFSREYRTFTGTVDGVPVSTMSTGMGGPSVAIGIEELHELGVHTLLRVGTCGASQPEIKMGDLVISHAAVRSEGTPNGYIPLEYPAVASLHVVEALVEAAEAAGAKYHVGVTRSVDALYSDLMPDLMPRPHLRDELAMWAKAGILSNDMEASTLFVVARLRKMRAGCVNLCVDELGAGEIHHLDPSYMDRMLDVAVDAIRRLIKRDGSAAERQ